MGKLGNFIVIGLLVISCSKQGGTPEGCDSSDNLIGDSEVNCKVKEVFFGDLRIVQSPANPEATAGIPLNINFTITNNGAESVDGLTTNNEQGLSTETSDCKKLSPGQG